MTRPLRVLCLDIEGGHGGSSRSLYFSLKHMDRSLVTPTVWCRRDGPIVQRYKEIGIPVSVHPGLPKASALPLLSRNLVQLAGHAIDFGRARETLRQLAEAAIEHDVVHFNHEGFAVLGRWLKSRTHTPITFHIRTNVVPSLVARQQMRLISRAVSAVVFITSNEERTFRALGGTSPGRVIFNVVEPVSSASPHSGIPRDGRLVVSSLSNAAWIRGTDRLLDIAEELRHQGSRDVILAVAGDMRLNGSWPGDLGAIARRRGTLIDAAKERGLQDLLIFLGHTSEPERILAATDLLVKPTRESNPWGRDIIEALSAGVPVLSVGQDQTFVESGKTGWLQPEFDAAELATRLMALAADRDEIARMGEAARQRVALLCNGPGRARELYEVWTSVSGTARP